MGRTLIAYSGGVDSGFLAWVAHQSLGTGMLAVIADSPSLARTHLADAIAFAHEHEIPLEVISTAELDRPEYTRNDAFRCFHCKDELFSVMEDVRRGRLAAEQHRVAAPLRDAGLTKADVRELARAAGLRIWDKAASACLSSRVEYGRPVTREILGIVEQGEDALRGLGFRQFRVRHHGDIVRIEIARDELPLALTPQKATEFTQIFKALGFKFVTLDLEGFRSGSMNTLLPPALLTRSRKSGS
jgi:uncharacterized protein